MEPKTLLEQLRTACIQSQEVSALFYDDAQVYRDRGELGLAAHSQLIAQRYSTRAWTELRWLLSIETVATRVDVERQH